MPVTPRDCRKRSSSRDERATNVDRWWATKTRFDASNIQVSRDWMRARSAEGNEGDSFPMAVKESKKLRVNGALMVACVRSVALAASGEGRCLPPPSGTVAHSSVPGDPSEDKCARTKRRPLISPMSAGGDRWNKSSRNYSRSTRREFARARNKLHYTQNLVFQTIGGRPWDGEIAMTRVTSIYRRGMKEGAKEALEKVIERTASRSDDNHH